jgi:rod shape-determining protein MreC
VGSNVYFIEDKVNLIFARNTSLQLRLVIAIVLSLGLIIGDRFTDSGDKLRATLNTVISPLFYFANLPYEIFNQGRQSLSSHQQLMDENSALRETQLLQNQKLQQFEFLQQENQKLRALLGSSNRLEQDKLITQVLSVHSNPYSHQVLINKGLLDDVKESTAVIDDQGIVGQVTRVSSTTSRVLLISDTQHAIPVRILRNNVRTVVEGIGKIDQLKLSHVPHSLDVRMGDILMSSGLGGVFPEGYPVAIVTTINRNEGRPFAEVFVNPIAQLDRIRLLILLKQQESKDD